MSDQQRRELNEISRMSVERLAKKLGMRPLHKLQKDWSQRSTIERASKPHPKTERPGASLSEDQTREISADYEDGSERQPAEDDTCRDEAGERKSGPPKNAGYVTGLSEQH
jgi:hypothetical protein